MSGWELIYYFEHGPVIYHACGRSVWPEDERLMCEECGIDLPVHLQVDLRKTYLRWKWAYQERSKIVNIEAPS